MNLLKICMFDHSCANPMGSIDRFFGVKTRVLRLDMSLAVDEQLDL